jgi:hypothetical protein
MRDKKGQATFLLFRDPRTRGGISGSNFYVLTTKIGEIKMHEVVALLQDLKRSTSRATRLCFCEVVRSALL